MFASARCCWELLCKRLSPGKTLLVHHAKSVLLELQTRWGCRKTGVPWHGSAGCRRCSPGPITALGAPGAAGNVLALPAGYGADPRPGTPDRLSRSSPNPKARKDLMERVGHGNYSLLALITLAASPSPYLHRFRNRRSN